MEMIGQTFGRLTITGAEGKRFSCVCSCGNACTPFRSMVKAGRTKSCGCLRAEITSARVKRHGMTKSPEFTAYQNAKNRCNRASDVRYKQYGGRGIEFRFTSFEQFLDCIGRRPDGTSLDRIDVDGHYEHGNVRWSALIEQANNKSNTRLVEINGEVKPLKEWCRIYGAPYKTVWGRIKSGWDAEKALSQIVAKKLWGTVEQTVVHIDALGAA